MFRNIELKMSLYERMIENYGENFMEQISEKHKLIFQKREKLIELFHYNKTPLMKHVFCMEYTTTHSETYPSRGESGDSPLLTDQEAEFLDDIEVDYIMNYMKDVWRHQKNILWCWPVRSKSSPLFRRLTLYLIKRNEYKTFDNMMMNLICSCCDMYIITSYLEQITENNAQKFYEYAITSSNVPVAEIIINRFNKVVPSYNNRTEQNFGESPTIIFNHILKYHPNSIDSIMGNVYITVEQHPYGHFSHVILDKVWRYVDINYLLKMRYNSEELYKLYCKHLQGFDKWFKSVIETVYRSQNTLLNYSDEIYEYKCYKIDQTPFSIERITQENLEKYKILYNLNFDV